MLGQPSADKSEVSFDSGMSMIAERVEERAYTTQWLHPYDRPYCRSALPVCAAMHLAERVRRALAPQDSDSMLGERRSWRRTLPLLFP